MIWAIFLFLIKGIVGLLAVLLLLLAMPFYYAVDASWYSGQGSLEWQLTWAWIVPLHKIIMKMLAGGDTDEVEAKAVKSNDSKKRRKSQQRSYDDDSPATHAERDRDSAVKQPRPKIDPAIKPSAEETLNAVSAQNMPQKEVAQQAEATSSSPNDTGQAGDAKDQSGVSVAGADDSSEEPELTTKQKASLLWARRRWFLHWLARFWTIFHFTPLTLQGRCGVGDPYRTHELFRVLVVLRCILPRGLRLDLQPDYLDLVLEGRIRISGWLSPLHGIYLGLAFILDRQTRELIRLLK